MRVGVHLGDVAVQPNGDLLGHGVNVAARLMAKSDPGGALASATVGTKRDPSAENVGQMRHPLLSRYEQTGGAEVSNLVYAAHVGLREDVFRLAETARLGPRGAADDVIGVDAYRTGLLFWRDMPEIRNDPRFRAPLRAARSRRVLASKRQMARLRRRDALRLPVRVRNGPRDQERNLRVLRSVGDFAAPQHTRRTKSCVPRSSLACRVCGTANHQIALVVAEPVPMLGGA